MSNNARCKKHSFLPLLVCFAICTRTFSNYVDGHYQWHAGDTSSDTSPILSSVTIDIWLLIDEVSILHTATHYSR